MKKLYSLSSFLNKQININPRNINLTFNSKYFARSTKKKPQNERPLQKKQNQQPTNANPNPESNPNLQNSNSNPQNNDKNNFNGESQQKNQTHITGPKRIIQLLKKGNVSLLPFYIKAFKNPIRNLPLPFKRKQFDQVNSKQSQPQAQANSDIKVQQRQGVKFESKNQQIKEQKDIYGQGSKQFRFHYPFKSSYLFQQRLLKKYKILQAIKSRRRTTLSNQSIKLGGWNRFKQNLMPPPGITSQVRVSVVVYIVLVAFLTIALKFTVHQQIHSEPVFEPNKENQLSDGQVQNRFRQIKQINIESDPYSQGNLTTKLTFVLHQKKTPSFVQRIFSNFGFDAQKNQKVTFQVQNPNIVLDGLEKVQENIDQKQWIKIKPIQSNYSYFNAFIDTLSLAGPFIGIAITYWIFTKMSPQSMMKGITSNKKSMKIQSTKDIKVRFKDVAGMENAKKQITQFVDFLKKSQKYVEMGAKIPKGALLTGPPGTGKTMLAKACAGEAGTSFFYVSGSEFVEMFVGLGASRVRQLFARARAEAPSIIFIDEIDAIGKKRQTSRNEEKDSTLNQMLVEMDGFSSTQTVIVLAATNRKDILDSALTRPGRFDRMVEITLPQIKARQQIFMVHLSPLKVNPNKPLPQLAKRLAQLTPGFSGADIANLCNQAAIIATRKKRNFIEDEDFEEASQRIMAGYIKKGLSNKKTKKRVAYHQAGHAVCGWYLKGGDPLVKLTIIPRSKGALGYAQYLPKTAYIRTRSELIDKIAIMLGGTVSQQVFLGNMSSGNSDDLQKVYGVARKMIAQFGMGSKTYNMTLDEQTYVKKQSQKLCNVVDSEMLQVVKQASERARRIIEQKREIVQQLTNQLLEKQTINDADILRIMGARPAFN